MLAFVVAVVTALVISFLCSISEAVLLSVRHSEVEALGSSRPGRILRKFKREIDVPIAAILILNTVANTAGSMVAGASFGKVFPQTPLWIFTAVFTVSILLFTEIVPKTLGVALAARLAIPVAYGVQFFVWVLRIPIFLTRLLSGWLRSGNEVPITSPEELRLLAALGSTEGVVLPSVAEMIEGAVNLRKLRARDVMVPRGGMAMLSATRSLEENLRIVKQLGHSRFPFSESGNPDEISGIVLAKALLFQIYEQPGDVDWQQVVDKALVVPETAPLERLLELFRTERRHMAIVVDEYGGTQGLVTLEDVLEEIVGEIEDETDRATTFIVKRSDGVLICRGWAETRKVFEALDWEDAESDSVSLGGYLFELAGRVPRVGEVLTHRDVEFKVTAAGPRRVERVEIRRREPAAEG